MQAESLNSAVSAESLGKLKDEGFVSRLGVFKNTFVKPRIYWQAEKPLIDNNPLAAELAPKNRYQATLVALLQKRTGKTLNIADFALYKPLAKEIQDIADNLGFDSKDPDINVVSFIECCLDKIGIPEAETQAGKPHTELVKLTSDHLDRLDPARHPEAADQLKVQFQRKKNGAWNKEVESLITSERALRELVTTGSRITSLLTYDLELLLRRPLTSTEMKDVKKMAGHMVRLANHCQLYSDQPDLDLLGFVRAARVKTGYTTIEYAKKLKTGIPTSARSRYEQRAARIPPRLLAGSLAIAVLGIIAHLQGLPIFAVQNQPPPAEPPPRHAPSPVNYPDVPASNPPPPQYPDSDNLPVPQTPPLPSSPKASSQAQEDDTLTLRPVREKPTPDWIFNPVSSFIKRVNEGKEIPPNRRNTMAIILAAKGGENYPSAIKPGTMEWHTDVNALLFITADPKTKKVNLDFVTPFTRDQLSTQKIGEGHPKIKLVASLIGKDAYKKEMSAVAGQPGEVVLVDRNSFAKAIDYIFPDRVTINIPVAFYGFKVGKHRFKGEELYNYLAERMSFTPENGYPVPDKNTVVTDNVARLQNGLNVMKDIIRNFKDDPLAVLRFKEAINYLDIDPQLKTSIDEFDFFGNGIGLLIGYLRDPKNSDYVTIRYHSTLDINVPSQYFTYEGTEDQYLDIVSPEPLSAGAQKHFQPITSAIDKIIEGK